MIGTDGEVKSIARAQPRFMLVRETRGGAKMLACDRQGDKAFAGEAMTLPRSFIQPVTLPRSFIQPGLEAGG